MTPEEMQEEILKLQEDMETMKLSNEELTKEKENQQTKINELTSINQKLFLKVTSPVKEEEEEDSDQEYKEYVGEKFWDKLSSVDKNKLKTILEGEDE